MLQSAPQQTSRPQLDSRYESPDQGLDLWSYVAILKRRKLLLAFSWQSRSWKNQAPVNRDVSANPAYHYNYERSVGGQGHG